MARNIFNIFQIILQNIRHLIVWFYATNGVNFCRCLAGLMIFRNSQNLENIQYDKL